MALQIQLRRDTSTNWTASNPILAQGEFGIETNTGKFKIGTGSTAWNSLAYSTPDLTGTSPITYSNGTIGINQSLITIGQSQVTNLVTDLAAKASLTGAETLTNKTLTAPRFATAGEIDDANGNELIRFPSTVASAVNEVTISNAATGGAPTITATGNDTNISLNFVAKGTGTVQVNGVTVLTVTGTAASATNLAGGTAGRIPYQSGAGTTLFTTVGTAGQVLTSNGTSAPTWSAPAATGFSPFLLSGM